MEATTNTNTTDTLGPEELDILDQCCHTQRSRASYAIEQAILRTVEGTGNLEALRASAKVIANLEALGLLNFTDEA